MDLLVALFKKACVQMCLYLFRCYAHCVTQVCMFLILLQVSALLCIFVLCACTSKASQKNLDLFMRRELRNAWDGQRCHLPLSDEQKSGLSVFLGAEDQNAFVGPIILGGVSFSFLRRHVASLDCDQQARRWRMHMHSMWTRPIWDRVHGSPLFLTKKA